MKKHKSKITYDSESDVLSLTQEGAAHIDHAEELGNFVVHFTKQDKPVLIEVLEASKLSAKNLKSLRQMVGLALA